MNIGEIKNYAGTATEILSRASKEADGIAGFISRDLAGRLIRYKHKSTGAIIVAKAGVAQVRGNTLVLLVYKQNQNTGECSRKHCVIDFAQLMDCTPAVKPKFDDIEVASHAIQQV